MVFKPITNLELILGLGSFLAAAYIGLAVYMRNSKSWTNRLFLFLASVIVVYILVNPVSLHPPEATPESQLFWIRVVMFTVSFMPPLLFLLVHTFPKSEIQLPVKYLIAMALLTVSAAAASLTPLVFRSVEYPEGSPVPIPGLGMPLFTLNFAGFLLLSFAWLFWKYRRATGQERAKVQFFLVGMIASFSLMTISTLVLVVIFMVSSAVFLGPIFTLFLMAAIGYSIARHRFLDIQPIVNRAVAFAAVLLIFSVVYAGLFYLFLQRFLKLEIAPALFGIFLFFTVAAMLSFQPIQAFFRKLTSRLFFRGAYDRDALLSRLTHIMAENIEIDRTTRLLMETLTKEIKIGKAAFLLMDKGRLGDIKSIGYKPEMKAFTEFENLMRSLAPAARVLTLEELEEGPLKDAFRRLEVAFAARMYVEANEVGTLVLGPKLSGEVYYPRDTELLHVFTDEAGIAIQNAKAYEEIQKFSAELEKRVEERTKELKDTEEREVAKAKELVKLKDEFVFIAAHELKTPVTAIRGFTELISEMKAKFPKDVRANLEAIYEASGNLNQLVNDLLQIARSESGTIRIQTMTVDIAPIILSTIKELSEIAKQKGILVRYEKVSTSLKVLSDESKLKEVLVNLIGNAVKYNRDGGSVDVLASKSDSHALVEVKDTGYGIPKEQQEKIFQKFFRAQNKDTEQVTGTGLGLFVTKMLVEKMGGQITFTSTEGKGSTFSFTLPLAKPLDMPVHKQRAGRNGKSAIIK